MAEKLKLQKWSMLFIREYLTSPTPIFFRNKTRWLRFVFMKLIFVRIGVLLFLAGLFTVGCTYDNEEELFDNPECSTLDVSYLTHIVPILDGNGCIGCHNVGSPAGNVSLDSHEGVKAASQDGSLLSSVNWNGDAAKMPAGASEQIDACSIDKISAWIEQGTLNN